MKINKLLTRYNFADGQADRIKYIVIHYVGATGGAKANCEYYASKYIGASAHYYVDFDGSIWQSVEDKDIAWHCGAKSYRHPECRNSNSIGIELCVRNKGNKAADSREWYFEDATVKAAIDLTKELMIKYNVDTDHVIRHYDVTGKICPNPFVYNHTKHTWEAFKAALTETEPTVRIEAKIPVSTSAAKLTITASSLVIRLTPKGEDTGDRYVLMDKVTPLEKCFADGDPWIRTELGWISANYVKGWLLQEGRWWYVEPGYTYPAAIVREIDGGWYAFDAVGWMITADRIRTDGSIA